MRRPSPRVRIQKKRAGLPDSVCSMRRLRVLNSETHFGSDQEPVPARSAGPSRQPGWLHDRHGRQLRYLRLSVTDRCDLRCRYCMPAHGIDASARSELLSFEEIVRLVRIFRRLGVRAVRLTGGEPLTRKGFVDLVRRLKDEAGIEDLAMTSNATALAVHAQALARAGLDRLNVSVDSLDPDVFRRLTRGGDLERVLRGIDAAQRAGIRDIKTNTVVVRGFNHRNLGPMVQWAWDRGLVPRFIELMPLGEGARLGRMAVVSVAEMKRSLASMLDLDPTPEHPADRGPASYLRDRAGRRVGFIGAVTENFCHRCNRVRVTAKGQIKACLASPEGLSVRDLLRQDGDDDRVVERVEQALFDKRSGHGFYVPGSTRHHAVHMSQIGG